MKQRHSTLVRRHLPCQDCGSSDALASYSDGHTHCFSCGTTHQGLTNLPKDDIISLDIPKGYPKERIKDTLHVPRIEYPYMKNHNEGYTEDMNTGITKDIPKYTRQLLPLWRGLTEATMKTYGVYFNVDTEGKPIQVVFPYDGDRAAKVRWLDRKDFFALGSMSEQHLFGSGLFNSGSSKYITITEGEVDAMSAYQMLGSKYPCVSVRNAQGARRDCEEMYTYLNSFERIYLCFDNDKPGQDAVLEVAKLFDVNKVYHVRLDKFKDANDYLVNNVPMEFTKVWWNAAPIRPKGIVTDFQQIKDILGTGKNLPIASWPFPTMEQKTLGIFSGKFYLFKAPEKVGKTEIIRAIEHHLLKTTDYGVAIIHLEENEKRSIHGLLSYEFNTPMHRPDCQVSLEDQLKAYEGLVKREGRLHFYTHFGSDDPDNILDVIRYLVAKCHCKFVFLDHISQIVSGSDTEENERKSLDRLSTKLLSMTRDLDFSLFCVSHVNDNGQTRGSRYIGKVADLIVSLDRNPAAENEQDRNKTKILIEGAREFGDSGPAGTLLFNRDSFTVAEMKPEEILADGIAPF